MCEYEKISEELSNGLSLDTQRIEKITNLLSDVLDYKNKLKTQFIVSDRKTKSINIIR